jgi:signal transduction histidine kinase
MVERLLFFSVLPFLALLVSAGYAVLATRDLADWRPALFTLLLVLMSVHQANEIGVYLSTGVASASRGFGEYPETAVNLLAGVAVWAVLRLLRDERRAADELERRIDEIRELERQNDRLEEFAAVVSHDLRNPLNTLEGYVQLAREEEDISRLAAAQRAIDRMTDIVDDSLALARRGAAVDETESVPVAELVRDCWTVVDTTDASLETESFTVDGDPDRLRHVFENLLRNAVDHADDGVTVRVGRSPTGFYVADDGPGIDPDRRSEVFELGHTTAADGTGFGLAIVERVAVAHGWDVRVTDSETGGARFEFDTGDSDAPAGAPVAEPTADPA